MHNIKIAVSLRPPGIVVLSWFSLKTNTEKREHSEFMGLVSNPSTVNIYIGTVEHS